MTYKIYLQKQIWLPAAIDERKIEEKKKLLTIVMRQFKIEGKNKITFLKRSKQKLFIHSRSQKVSLPNTLPRGFKHLAGAPQERPASSHQE